MLVAGVLNLAILIPTMLNSVAALDKILFVIIIKHNRCMHKLLNIKYVKIM